ncbi:MAG: hypothetical protein NTZ44_00200, partial [Candidatus Nomurabacteria bacterium]|nr:hypothetical protein [Candidatus Nomurabacteria bacterium]
MIFKKKIKIKFLLNILIVVLVIATAFSSFLNNTNASSSYIFSMKIGSFGSGPGEFHTPETIAVDPNGDIYVGEGHTQIRTHKFESDGNFISFLLPYANTNGGMAVDASHNLYITNQTLYRIEEYDSSGTFIKTFGWGVNTGAAAFEICEPISHLLADCQTGTLGSGDGQFWGMGYITIDSNGKIYIPDWNNGVIQRFNSDATFDIQFGSGSFDTPQAVSVDLDGNIYATDYGNRVQKFLPSGVLDISWGSSGTSEGHFSFPTKSVIDSKNHIFVFDSGRQRIQEFDTLGNFISMFGWGVDDGTNAFQVCVSGCQSGYAGAGDGQFNTQIDYGDLAIDANDNIYATDFFNRRFQKFILDYNPTLTLTPISPDPTNNTTPVLSGTSTDDLGTVASVEFQMDGVAGAWTACVADDAAFDEISETFTCTPSALAEGGHTMYVRTTDNNSHATEDTDNADIFTIDLTAPIISETTTVNTPSTNHNPSYTFTTDEAGDITYGGSCTSTTTSATVGANTIIFNNLSSNTYSNCTITVTDSVGNPSLPPLSVSSFEIRSENHHSGGCTSNCNPPPNPCIANPGLPQCPNHCTYDPTLLDCQEIRTCVNHPEDAVCQQEIRNCTNHPEDTNCNPIYPPPPPPPPPPNPTSPSTPVTQPITEIIPITTPPIQIQTPPSPLKTFLKLLTK